MEKQNCVFRFRISNLFCSLQNMLLEIEQKVSYLSELSLHSESLLLEGRAETKGEAEQLTVKLRSLKDSLVELQQMLQDKQIDIQVRSLILFIVQLFSSLHMNIQLIMFKHFFYSLTWFFLCVTDSSCAVFHCVTQCNYQWWYCLNSKGHVSLI